jgi:hypothetical protein
MKNTDTFKVMAIEDHNWKELEITHRPKDDDDLPLTVLDDYDIKNPVKYRDSLFPHNNDNLANGDALVNRIEFHQAKKDHRLFRHRYWAIDGKTKHVETTEITEFLKCGNVKPVLTLMGMSENAFSNLKF